MYNYSTVYQTFFIHLPKNAGTSVNEYLKIEPKNRGHHSPTSLIELYADRYTTSNSFAIVRNPWDRLVSLYEFRKQKNYIKHLKAGHNFKDWLLNTNTPRYAGNLEWEQQVNVLSNSSGWLVKSIIKYEELSNYFNDLPHSNVTSSREHYTNYYDYVTRTFVENYFKKDIEMFNYEF